MKSVFNRRPLFWLALVYIMGVITGYYLFSRPVPVFIALCIKFAGLYIGYHRGLTGRLLLVLLIVFVLGLSMMAVREANYNHPASLNRWNGREGVEVRGKVIRDLTRLTGDRVYLKPFSVGGEKVKYGLIQLDTRYLSFNPEDGDILKLKLDLTQPSPQTNPGGFSYQNYLKQKGVYSQGSQQGDVTYLGKNSPLWKRGIINLKSRLLQVIDRHLHRPYNLVIGAILLGERARLPKDWERLFQRGSASHLLAISGLHVGFIILVLLGLNRFFVNSNTFPGNLLISLVVVIYALVTGGRPSVVRAGMLSVLFLWAPYFKRQGDVYNILGLAALLALLYNPYLLFTVGFQLTYVVLLMILSWSQIFSGSRKMVMSVPLAAQFGSLPLIGYYFNQIAPVGVITNIWAIPLAGIIVMLSLIMLATGLIVPSLAPIPGFLIEALLFLLKQGMSLMTAIPGAYFPIKTPNPLIVLAVYFCLLSLPYFLRPRMIPKHKRQARKKARLLILILIISLIMYTIFPLPEPGLKLVFFDVGQGDSILIKSPESGLMLVDGGGRAGEDSNQGERVLLPYFRHRGIKELEAVVITHFDTDHALGLTGVLQEIRVKQLILPENHDNNQLARRILKLAQRRRIPIVTVSRGDYLQLGGVYFRVLHPLTGGVNTGRNENSLVFKLVYGEFSVLMTGDLEYEGEKALLNRSDRLESNVLKVAHHGSGGSTGEDFLEEVKPEVSVISVGYNNFGHPEPSVIQRLRQKGSRVFRTDNQGAIIINSQGGRDYQIKTWLD